MRVNSESKILFSSLEYWYSCRYAIEMAIYGRVKAWFDW